MANDRTAPAPADSGGSPAAAIDWGYDPAPESADIVRLRSSYRLLIGGEWVDPADGRWFKTINPASEEVLAEVAEAGPRDVERAVAAARAALPAWAALPGAERAKYLFRVARIVQERARGWRCWSPWTAASRSRSPATSTCPWSPGTSSTTPGGRTSWRTPSPAAAPARSACAPR